MITTQKFFSLLKKKKINFFTGVPDSCLKHFTNLIFSGKNNVIAANEGSAVATGIGYHLKTKKIPLVYLQNSGIGNAMDPLTSLATKESYSIPMVLLVGWRGSPTGKKDEPQHRMMGRITKKLLKLMDIKTQVIKSDKDLPKISKLINYTKKNNKPVALLIDRGVFSKTNHHHIHNYSQINLPLRSEAIEDILKNVKKNSKIISTVGFTSRELYQIRKVKKYKNGRDFLMIGGMGHTAATSLGISLFDKNDVYCLDGDGSFLMHMGGVASAVAYTNKNLKYILFDNNSHESVGPTNQPTISNKINFKKIAEGLNFDQVFEITNIKDLLKLKKYLKSKGSIFILIKIKSQSLSNLTRPKSTYDIKRVFMKG